MKFNASKEPKEEKANPEKAKPKFYYAIIPDELDDDERVPDYMKPTWRKLYRWCKHKKSWNPSVTRFWDKLSKLTRVPVSTLQKHVRKFEETGWATKESNEQNKPITIILHKKCQKPQG
jgi:hypothetical protein